LRLNSTSIPIIAFGGVLGILFLIPFRKYFVSDMHGKFPFPDATATTEVLVSGEKGGKQARLLVVSGLIGGIYDFIIATFGWWSEVVTTRVIPAGEALAAKAKLVFKLNVGAAVMGIGYIIGLKYTAIIAAGSFVGWFVIIPIINYFAPGLTETVGSNVTLLVGDMSAEQIFSTYVRPIVLVVLQWRVSLELSAPVQLLKRRLDWLHRNYSVGINLFQKRNSEPAETFLWQLLLEVFYLQPFLYSFSPVWSST
jgi:uncharacterized oligopeptide transporter (OPT) family protein